MICPVCFRQMQTSFTKNSICANFMHDTWVSVDGSYNIKVYDLNAEVGRLVEINKQWNYITLNCNYHEPYQAKFPGPSQNITVPFFEFTDAYNVLQRYLNNKAFI